MFINIKENVKDSKKAKFAFYTDKELWYETEDGTKFPVPISDTGTGTFFRDMKAIYLMRWMRKWNENLEEMRK